MQKSLILKDGKDKSLRNRHPWIFSGAIHKASPVEAGETVEVRDGKQRFLAYAYLNPATSLAARVVSWREDVPWNEATLKKRIEDAFARRRDLLREGQDAARIVASEADHLPGLIVDLYADWVVFQILTAGMERMRAAIIDSLKDVFRPTGLVERSDEAIRKKEGLDLRREIIFGSLPAGGVTIREDGIAIKVDLWDGHKTGFYLDQRANRRIVQAYAQGKRVLNCFSFSGGFSLAALKGSAREVISVDESQGALALAIENVRMNFGEAAPHCTVQADVFQYLRQLRERNERFDLIVLDPPKFVSDRKHIDRACRGYKDLNLLAMQLLTPNGILATFSCSGLISRDLFQKVVFGASIDAPCEIQVLEQLSQSDDHPLLLSFPESLYLKGLICRKIPLEGGT